MTLRLGVIGMSNIGEPGTVRLGLGHGNWVPGERWGE